MAKNKEPWNNEIYGAMQESREGTPQKRSNKRKEASTNFLTFLVILLVVIIGVIIMIIVWNNRLVDNTKISSSFYTSKSSISKSVSSEVSSNASEASSESSSEATPPASSSSAAPTGDTTTVQAGEGLYAIAARTGASAEVIAKANGMTVANWYANPGDVIKLK
ncbi:SAG1386/EF1546 family surface-associated protein [Pseudolactococcus paracarnosus]|uniref:LysM peptidoglycan-binding domain-containing protein n=1 Tax=Pseudolactococcus paracarnosus TaxID=2749962 RepID=A0ABT0AJH0_9LACT|nr:SAG1386/EF1546 family surface-associated protein [Lactococcus paracarnosus]MCJ1976643.1 LysM peptidoglycan-binding domain-containing protein [Lactococcus paracarnosus]MCJ1982566.1 LysM peptidoglycan-binding domain-containing protein [Lactococcus paracarnosus]MCJ1997654.1 LysM peptidoglycan-binding domain-containing protein [Lactococcus paracarnosus]